MRVELKFVRSGRSGEAVSEFDDMRALTALVEKYLEEGPATDLTLKVEVYTQS